METSPHISYKGTQIIPFPLLPPDQSGSFPEAARILPLLFQCIQTPGNSLFPWDGYVMFLKINGGTQL